MHRIRFLALLLCAGAGGCSLAPPYKPPKLAVVPTRYGSMGPWTPAAPNDTAPRGDWWRVFGDPVLDRLEAELSSGNPTLAIYLSRYDQAQQVIVESSAPFYPQVDLDGGVTQNKQSAHRPLRVGGPEEYEDALLEGNVSWDLDLWGRVRNTVASGRDLAQAAQEDTADVRLSLEAQLADAYFDLRGQDAQVRLLNATATDYGKALQLTELQHAGGIASGLDVGRAQTQYSSVQAQATDALAQRDQDVFAIATLVGVPAPLFSLPFQPVLPPAPAVPVAAPSLLLERRPDVAAAERRAASANAGIGVARAAFFPDITLSASGGFESNGGGINLFDGPNTLWSLGPELAYTVIDFGARRAALRIAVDDFNQAGETYRATVLTAFQQVEDNLVLANRLAVEADEEAVAVAAADRTAQLSETLYSLGATTYLDVVTAQTADLQAEQAALTIAERRLRATVDLVRALGGGWQAPAAQLHTLAARPGT